MDCGESQIVLGKYERSRGIGRTIIVSYHTNLCGGGGGVTSSLISIMISCKVKDFLFFFFLFFQGTDTLSRKKKLQKKLQLATIYDCRTCTI